MFYIGFSTNYINIPVYSNYKVLQVTLGKPSVPQYDNIVTIKKTKTKIFIHSKYTYNISKKNINYPIKTEIEFLKSINEENTGIVIHLSKYYTKTRYEGLLDVSNKLNELCLKYLYKTSYSILLETSNIYEHLGSRIDDFYTIYDNLTDLSKQHIGICLDTSHLFLSGTDISNINILLDYLAMFEQKIGLKRIKLIHLNDIDSKLFGTHTPHLSILDENGKIFFNNHLILDIILLVVKIYNIPIILERNDSKTNINNINTEINYINEYNNNFEISTFNTIIKNLIILNFISLLEDYYTYIDNKKLIYLNKFKKFIIEIYNYKNKQYMNSKKLYKPDTIILDFLKNNEYNFLYADINNIFNNYSYEIFLNYINDINYKNLKELNNIKFLGIETVKKLYYTYHIHNLEELQKLPIAEKKKLLTIPQYKALQCYKFMNKETPLDVLLQICDHILSINFNLHIYGSIYRYKNSLLTQNEKQFKDIDLLIVVNKDNEINEINEFFKILETKFLIKGTLLNGDRRKNLLLKYNIKRKNYYFLLDLYICNNNEYVFMSIYLKGPKENNIILRKIAKHKGYILSNVGLVDLRGNKYYFNSEEELYHFLKYKK